MTHRPPTWPIAGMVIVLSTTLVGCGPSGPPSTRSNSSGLKTVEGRVRFLNQYVRYRPTYETLDYDILYQNNGGLAPSEWDVRVVATVPASELQDWVPKGVGASSQDRDWLKTVPTSLGLSGINEWYGEGGRIVGLDRQRRIVVYRNWSR